MRRRYSSELAVLAIGLLGACGGSRSGPDVQLEGLWARAMPFLSEAGGGPGTNSAVYGTIKNLGPTQDVLLGGSTDAAALLEVHESRMQGDVMRMGRVDRLEIPARGVVELKPGGLHIMLVGISESLLEGGEIRLTLRFQRAGEIRATVPVRLLGAG